MLNITVRDARYSDLPAIAHVTAQAFWDDGFFGELLFPRRDQYPGDVELWFLRHFRVNFWNYRWKWQVAVEKDAKGTETIVGVVQWSRVGPGGQRMELFALDPRNLLAPLSAFAMKITTRLWPNRASDPTKEDILAHAHGYYKIMWTGEREEAYYLEALGVLPGHQGKGIGRKLAQWGMDGAAKEGVYASVISAPGKEPFYYKIGFEYQLGTSAMGEGNPMRTVGDGQGGPILWVKKAKTT